MKALLIIAHGSRSQDANDEVGQLAKCIEGNTGSTFDRVTHAFLEIASPSVDTAIADLAATGATGITVFPYFLAGGVHVAKDIPHAVECAKRAFPEIDFEILPYLGALEGISGLILKQIDVSAPGLD